MNVTILEEIIYLSNLGEKEHSRGSSFRPFKYYKYEAGKNTPTFFIGSPGINVAISTTLIVVMTIILISLKFNIWLWILYFIFSAFLTRLGMKMDKAKQIRGLVYAIVRQSVSFIKEYNKTQDIEMLKNAKHLLEEAQKWADEPALKKQIEIIEEVITKKPS